MSHSTKWAKVLGNGLETIRLVTSCLRICCYTIKEFVRKRRWYLWWPASVDFCILMTNSAEGRYPSVTEVQHDTLMALVKITSSMNVCLPGRTIRWPVYFDSLKWTSLVPTHSSRFSSICRLDHRKVVLTNTITLQPCSCYNGYACMLLDVQLAWFSSLAVRNPVRHWYSIIRKDPFFVRFHEIQFSRIVVTRHDPECFPLKRQ